MVERLPVKEMVTGSSPVPGAKQIMQTKIKQIYSYKNKKYKKLFTREYMVSFFKIYSGSRCPACKKVKNVNHWLCLNCLKKVLGSKEVFDAAPKCDAHIVAIQKMITKAQKK